MINFLVKLIKGEFSLEKTFWFGLLAVGCQSMLYEAWLLISPPKSPILIWTVILLGTSAKVIWFGAVWESASKFKGEKLWAWLAKIYVVVQLLVGFNYLFHFHVN